MDPDLWQSLDGKDAGKAFRNNTRTTAFSAGRRAATFRRNGVNSAPNSMLDSDILMGTRSTFFEILNYLNKVENSVYRF